MSVVIGEIVQASGRTRARSAFAGEFVTGSSVSFATARTHLDALEG